MSRVTVVMPVYNGERYLREAVQSILNQTYSDFTLLCIDDCSVDNSWSILQSFDDSRIKIIQNEKNGGIAYTRNRGLDIAESEYIALLDDDDIALPYRLEHEVKYLDEHPEIQVVGGHQRQIDENGIDQNKQWSVCLNPDYINAYLMLNNTIVNGSTLFRKEFVDKYHIRYKDYMYGAEDYMFWVECSVYGKIKNLDEVFLLWRVAGQNETFKMISEEFKEKRMKALKEIREKAITSKGICLSDNELEGLNKAFFEDGPIDSKEELEELFSSLKNIAGQAKELQLFNQREIVTMCRKQFGEKVGKAFFLWE